MTDVFKTLIVDGICRERKLSQHHFENLSQTLIKSDAKSDFKHVRSLIDTRLDALESEVGEIKSTRATKSITNRLTEQTGLLRTKIDELKNKLDRELDEASDDLKDEIKGKKCVSTLGQYEIVPEIITI